jgi:hypothetical protein
VCVCVCVCVRDVCACDVCVCVWPEDSEEPWQGVGGGGRTLGPAGGIALLLLRRSGRGVSVVPACIKGQW